MPRQREKREILPFVVCFIVLPYLIIGLIFGVEPQFSASAALTGERFRPFTCVQYTAKARELYGDNLGVQAFATIVYPWARAAGWASNAMGG